jgi:acyl-CoA thioester hydrolase
VAYADRVGLTALLDQQRIGPILAAVACNYRRQIRFPDTVQVGARITRLGRSSMTMEHRVVSEAQQAVTGEGDSTIVTFNYAQQQVVPIPEPLRAAIGELEGRSL